MGNLVKQIDGINISPMKIINEIEGFIMHALKKNGNVLTNLVKHIFQVLITNL